MSELSDAITEGLSELSSAQGAAWSFKGNELKGAVSGDLEPVDPQMQGAAERRFPVTVPISNLPSTKPARGDTLTSKGKSHTVVKAFYDWANGVAIFTVSIS